MHSASCAELGCWACTGDRKKSRATAASALLVEVKLLGLWLGIRDAVDRTHLLIGEQQGAIGHLH